jgi:hypothetical protein
MINFGVYRIHTVHYTQIHTFFFKLKWYFKQRFSFIRYIIEYIYCFDNYFELIKMNFEF